MTSPIPIGLPQLYDRIGRTQSNLPDLRGDLQGVVIYADWSRSLSSEVFEARGLSGFNINAVGGEFCRFQLVARTPGGSVVESILISAPGASLLTLQVTETPNPAWSFGPVPRFVADVGGVQIADVVQDGRSLPGGFIGYASVPVPTVPFGERWFVHPGHTLDVLCGTAGVAMTYSVQWRELAGFSG